MSMTSTTFAFINFSERLDLQHSLSFVSAGVRDTGITTHVESHVP